jgi:hypothetical protein
MLRMLLLLQPHLPSQVVAPVLLLRCMLKALPASVAL